MTTIINSKSRQAAINSCSRFLGYFPYRYAAIADIDGVWGWCNGKTKARMNSLARKGVKVYMVTRHA